MQLSGVDVVNNAPQLITKNAGTAEVKGLEAEMQFAIADYHRLDLALTLQSGKFRKYAAPVNETETIDFSGKELDRSPDLTFALSYTYTQAFPSGAHIDYNLRSSYSDSYVIANRARIYEQPDYTSTGVSVTYHSADDSWYVKAFAKNLEDEVQLSVVSTSYSIGTSPRTWGVGAGIKF